MRQKVINHWAVKSWHFIWKYHQKYIPQGHEMNQPCVIKLKNAPESTANLPFSKSATCKAKPPG